MAAALAGMVAAMSRGKKTYIRYEDQLSEAIARLTTLREELKAAIDADADSYKLVMKAYKAAKESPDGGRLIVAALREATSVPLGVAQMAVETAQIAATLKPITNPNMSSDLETSIALSAAALTGALANVAINLDSIKPETAEDDAFVSETRKQAEALKLPG
jgi:glutamate formiminotransferase/formiminotetrahydrofolate cyclodeaminase